MKEPIELSRDGFQHCSGCTCRPFFAVLTELLLGPALAKIQQHQPVVVKLAAKVLRRL
jgi:hypothetical protein